MTTFPSNALLMAPPWLRMSPCSGQEHAPGHPASEPVELEQHLFAALMNADRAGSTPGRAARLRREPQSAWSARDDHRSRVAGRRELARCARFSRTSGRPIAGLAWTRTTTLLSHETFAGKPIPGGRARRGPTGTSTRGTTGTVLSDGLGTTVRVGCHPLAGSDAFHTTTMGARDFVYTPVPC